MLVKDMLSEICRKENVISYKEIPVERYVEYQLDKSITRFTDYKEDFEFQKFYEYLNKIFTSRVNLPTAHKILNNGYRRK